MFPGASGDGVVVVNLLTESLIPLGSSLIEGEHIESIVVSNDGGHSRVVEGSTGELLNLLIFAVAIANCESITSGFVENDLAIISCRQNVVTPG